MSRVVISAPARSSSVTGSRCRRRRCARCLRACRPGAVEHDDLAPAGGGVVGVGRASRRRGAGSGGSLDHAVGLAGHDVGAVGQADVEGLAAAPQGEEQLVGVGGGAGGDGDRALEARPPCCGRPSARSSPSASRRATSVGMTLASVVISGAMRRPSAALRSAKLSTSPLSSADHVGPVGPVALLVAVERVGVGLGDDPDSTPSGCGRARRRPPASAPSGQAQQVVGPDGRRAAPGCCRPARRSRPPPCRRRPGGRRGCAPCRERNSGSAVRPRSSPATAGLSRSRPWSRTSTCRPAESRPRTSSRSMADSACWIDV